MDPGKKWQAQLLPMLPKRWPMMEIESSKKQLKSLRALMRSKEFSYVVCATDAGREGEWIFRSIYEYVGCRLPVKRLWISSLSSESIRTGFSSLFEQSRFDGLAKSAQARRKLIGW